MIFLFCRDILVHVLSGCKPVLSVIGSGGVHNMAFSSCVEHGPLILYQSERHSDLVDLFTYRTHIIANTEN